MDYESKIVMKAVAFLLPVFILVCRLIVTLPSTRNPLIQQHNMKEPFKFPIGAEGSDVMIFLGSGGHTGEMMKILANVDLSNFTRTWVTSSTDSTSILKCKEYEDAIDSEYKPRFITLHRARSVGEPLIASAKNTVLSFLDTFKQLYRCRRLPSVLLVNGPGTSVPIAYILFFFKFIGVGRTRIIYIESLARVDDLSLSGKLLVPIADRLIVQWQELAWKYKRAEYYGILV